MDRLLGVVQDYDWGDHDAIARILGHDPPGHPEAEYWLGAHPKAPSTLVNQGRHLDDALAADPGTIVGPEVSARFARLPYLLKILAADRPLSIQAHPSPAEARAGFAREEISGPDRADPERNYRDDNHKPELICAITDFEAKCGFRAVVDTRRLLATMDGPVAAELAAMLEGDGEDVDILARVVGRLLRLDPVEAARLSDGLAAAAADASARGDRERLDGFDAELAWVGRTHQAFPGDIGVVVSALLNHVTLAPGQAVFLEAGNLHCYLKGVGVELMANSDNVLRGGLTTKHIDVDELLSVVTYRPTSVPVQTAAGPVHRFDIPVPEFGLERFDSELGPIQDRECETKGPEIVLVTQGAVELTPVGNDGGSAPPLRLEAGQAGFVSYTDRHYTIGVADRSRTVAWRATVGSIRPG